MAFYATLGFATLIGVGLNFTAINPIKALYWSAVINGVTAVPVMALLMMMTAQTRVMGEFTVRGWLRWLGWLSTAAMATLRRRHGPELVPVAEPSLARRVMLRCRTCAI